MISYLEMHSPESLLAKEAARGLEVRECRIPQYQFNRFLYHYVGAPWGWSDKLSWTDARWQDYVENPRLRTWIGYLDGSPAGYFELQQQEEGNVEIAYFGLVERFMGMGFGGYLLTQAIRDDDPVIFLENKLLYDTVGEVPDGAYSIPFGEASILREGEDATIIAIGRMVQYAREAAATLAAEGIDCTVVDPRTTSPLDEDTILEMTEETGRVVIVDEANPRCGIAADISSIIAENAFGALKAPIMKVTAPHTPVPYAPNLEAEYLPDARKIADAVRRTMAYRR